MQEWPTGADEKPPSGVSAFHLVALSPGKSVMAKDMAVQAQARGAAEGILTHHVLGPQLTGTAQGRRCPGASPLPAAKSRVLSMRQGGC